MIWDLWLIATCVSVILIVVVHAVVRLYTDETLPPPDKICEREIPKHWRVGSSSTGYRRG